MYLFVLVLFDSSPPSHSISNLILGFFFFWCLDIYFFGPFSIFFSSEYSLSTSRITPLSVSLQIYFFFRREPIPTYPDREFPFLSSQADAINLIDRSVWAVVALRHPSFLVQQHIYTHIHPREKKKRFLFLRKKKKKKKHNPKGYTEKGKSKTLDLYQPTRSHQEKKIWQTNTAL